jgi:uncharacterized delta-60 repeat protein
MLRATKLVSNGKLLRRCVFGVIAAVAVASCSSAHSASTSTAAGTLDSGFGSGGKVSTNLSSRFDRARAVAVQTDGKIVVAGSTQDPTQGDNFAVVRYTSSGELDTRFGNGGKVSTDLGTKADRGDAVVVQRDGKILVAGTTADPAQGDNFLLLRYNG